MQTLQHLVACHWELHHGVFGQDLSARQGGWLNEHKECEGRDPKWLATKCLSVCSFSSRSSFRTGVHCFWAAPQVIYRKQENGGRVGTSNTINKTQFFLKLFPVLVAAIQWQVSCRWSHRFWARGCLVANEINTSKMCIVSAHNLPTLYFLERKNKTKLLHLCANCRKFTVFTRKTPFCINCLKLCWSQKGSKPNCQAWMHPAIICIQCTMHEMTWVHSVYVQAYMWKERGGCCASIDTVQKLHTSLQYPLLLTRDNDRHWLMTRQLFDKLDINLADLMEASNLSPHHHHHLQYLLRALCHCGTFNNATTHRFHFSLFTLAAPASFHIRQPASLPSLLVPSLHIVHGRPFFLHSSGAHVHAILLAFSVLAYMQCMSDELPSPPLHLSVLKSLHQYVP